MSAVYNEVEPFACAWLENLIAAGHIAPGRVDARSIRELAATDVLGRGQRHFFAGIAGWSLALRLAGVPDDADVWTGSCPCQPFSVAGKGKGVDDDRHLWPVWFELIRERRPPVVFGEQVASAVGLEWLAAVRADLEGAGYAVGASDLCASSVGAPHSRQRIFFGAVRMGDADHDAIGWHGGAARRAEAPIEVGDRAVGVGPRASGQDVAAAWRDVEWLEFDDPVRGRIERPVEPGLAPVALGVPGRLGKLRAYGNAIAPAVAAEFIRAFLDAVSEQLRAA